jgi:hypothetical protein
MSAVEIVRIVLSEVMSEQATTFCLIPAEPNAVGALVATKRTAKVMWAAAAGIPIVSLSWLQECLAAEVFVAPAAAHFVRSLPSPTITDPSANFGVAALAQAFEDPTGSQGPPKLLADSISFLVDGFGTKEQTEVSQILEAAGSEVAKNFMVFRNKTCSKWRFDERKPIVLCPSWAAPLPLELKAMLQEVNERVIVVDKSWLFDSITCGVLLPSDAYKHVDAKPGSQA